MLKRIVTTGTTARTKYEEFQLRNQGPLLFQEWYAPGAWSQEDCLTWLNQNPNIIQVFHLGIEPPKDIIPAYMGIGFDEHPVVICRLEDNLYWSANEWTGSAWADDFLSANTFQQPRAAQLIIDKLGCSLSFLPMRVLCQNNQNFSSSELSSKTAG